ncbi:hypothetical protein MY04_3739 [Flammeovirga sp. MY04]|uniref:hypothetical protein n=1 Tax=Flammeovirga sp. MY04 TaxID=1191459 RepID=UPI0008063C02|nr:hypothetical protein [Flammeovirga sp. MY04]ANQ51083.1 hypothetical protein MY04_3739 [Flammeovirga sp. MY04]
MKIFYFRFYSLLVLFSIVISTQTLKAQGCSDAGVCSIGPMTHNNTMADDASNGEIRVKPTYSLGEKQTHIIGLQLEADYNVNDKVYFQFVMPYIVSTGDLGTAAGLGDITLSLSVPVYKNDNVIATVFGGTKIPLNDGNLSDNGKALPMAYQPSLGTFDALAGIAVNVNKFLFSAGYQHPLTQNNSTYVNPNQTAESKLLTTNGYERMPDLALRAEYKKTAESKDKWSWKAGLLGIYHIGEDSYVDPETNERINIENSSGLTLNITGGIVKTFDKYTIGSDLGFPVMAREARPDGLTRTVALSFWVGWKF